MGGGRLKEIGTDLQGLSMEDKSSNLSEPGVLAYRRVDPLANRRDITWCRDGDALTITILSSASLRRIIGHSLALVFSVGLGIVCWLIASVYASDVRPLLVIPA